MMRFIVVALLVLAALPAFADSLEVTQTPEAVTAKTGELVSISAKLKNILSPRDPILLTATVTYDDEHGVERTTMAATEVAIKQPVKLGRYAVAIGSFHYLADSGALAGSPVTSSLVDGVLIFDLGGCELLESESATLEYTLRAQ